MAMEILERIKRQKRESWRRWKERHPDKAREHVEKSAEIMKKALRTLTVIKNTINKRESIKLRNSFMTARFLALYFLATRYGEEKARRYLEEEFGFRV